jgi:nitrite reductase/ring-hydroxylating ferredoxin subunit
MTITIYLSLFFLVLYVAGLAIQQWRFLRDRQRMRQESRGGDRIVARTDELQPGSVRKFWIICQKYRVDGLLVNDRGHYHAYVNRCRHMPTPLDFVRHEFLSEDRKHLMCYTHGALYDFASGLCIAGPCRGESLHRLPVRVDRGEVLVGCPQGDLSYLKE